MKTIGIIAEYNPFHMGHAHHLSCLANRWPKALRIIVMSGAFVQRGGPALFSKFNRARWAVEGGADLVLEVPSLYASAHAETFASGAVRLLGALQVEGLSFGSEITNSDLLESVASLSSQAAIQDRCRQLLKGGLYYGAALRQAMIELAPEAKALANAPNALLGLEYIRAINAYHLDMIPLPIERQSSHHEEALGQALPSGTALRQAIQAKGPLGLNKYFPETVFPLLEEAIQKGAYLDSDRYDQLVLSQARRQSTHELAKLQDFTEGLENKWTKAAASGSWARARETIKSKRYSYARLDRMAAYSLLGITKVLFKEAQEAGPTYARLLAFNEAGRDWLRLNDAKIPIIQKWAPFYKEAQGFTKKSLEIDALATDLQTLCFHQETYRQGRQDFTYTPQFIKD